MAETPKGKEQDRVDPPQEWIDETVRATEEAAQAAIEAGIAPNPAQTAVEAAEEASNRFEHSIFTENTSKYGAYDADSKGGVTRRNGNGNTAQTREEKARRKGEFALQMLELSNLSGKLGNIQQKIYDNDKQALAIGTAIHSQSVAAGIEVDKTVQNIEDDANVAETTKHELRQKHKLYAVACEGTECKLVEISDDLAERDKLLKQLEQTKDPVQRTILQNQIDFLNEEGHRDKADLDNLLRGNLRSLKDMRNLIGDTGRPTANLDKRIKTMEEGLENFKANRENGIQFLIESRKIQIEVQKEMTTLRAEGKIQDNQWNSFVETQQKADKAAKDYEQSERQKIASKEKQSTVISAHIKEHETEIATHKASLKTLENKQEELEARQDDLIAKQKDYEKIGDIIKEHSGTRASFIEQKHGGTAAFTAKNALNLLASPLKKITGSDALDTMKAQDHVQRKNGDVVFEKNGNYYSYPGNKTDAELKPIEDQDEIDDFRKQAWIEGKPFGNETDYGRPFEGSGFAKSWAGGFNVSKAQESIKERQQLLNQEMEKNKTDIKLNRSALNSHEEALSKEQAYLGEINAEITEQKTFLDQLKNLLPETIDKGIEVAQKALPVLPTAAPLATNIAKEAYKYYADESGKEAYKCFADELDAADKKAVAKTNDKTTKPSPPENANTLNIRKQFGAAHDHSHGHNHNDHTHDTADAGKTSEPSPAFQQGLA